MFQKYSDEQIEKMKAKLLSNMVTVVKAEVLAKAEEIPEITIHENVTKEYAARLAFEVPGKIIVVQAAEDNEQESIEDAVFEAKQRIYKLMEELGC